MQSLKYNFKTICLRICKRCFVRYIFPTSNQTFGWWSNSMLKGLFGKYFCQAGSFNGKKGQVQLTGHVRHCQCLCCIGFAHAALLHNVHMPVPMLHTTTTAVLHILLHCCTAAHCTHVSANVAHHCGSACDLFIDR